MPGKLKIVAICDIIMAETWVILLGRNVIIMSDRIVRPVSAIWNIYFKVKPLIRRPLLVVVKRKEVRAD